jgi:hypothetical protein
MAAGNSSFLTGKLWTIAYNKNRAAVFYIIIFVLAAVVVVSAAVQPPAFVFSL